MGTETKFLLLEIEDGDFTENWDDDEENEALFGLKFTEVVLPDWNFRCCWTETGFWDWDEETDEDGDQLGIWCWPAAALPIAASWTFWGWADFICCDDALSALARIACWCWFLLEYWELEVRRDPVEDGMKGSVEDELLCIDMTRCICKNKNRMRTSSKKEKINLGYNLTRLKPEF